MAYEFTKNGKAADIGCSGSPNSKTSRCRLSSYGDAYGVIRLADGGLLKSVSNPKTLISILCVSQTRIGLEQLMTYLLLD